MSESALRSSKWTLKGYDTFEGGDDAWYSLPGEFDTEPQAVAAAQERLKELEESQPAASSGGQREGGIQDQVYIVSPEGRLRRITG
jgi:hypothetical protein